LRAQEKGRAHKSWAVKGLATRSWYWSFKSRHPIVSKLESAAAGTTDVITRDAASDVISDDGSQGDVGQDLRSPDIRHLADVTADSSDFRACHDVTDQRMMSCSESDIMSEVFDFVGDGVEGSDGYRSDVDMFDGSVWPPLPPIPYEVWAPPPRDSSPEIGIRPPLPKNIFLLND